MSVFKRIAFRASAIGAKLGMRAVCHNKYMNLDALVKLVEARRPEQPLVTVANHTSVFDEPLMWSAMPWHLLLRPEKMRKSLAAEEILFPNPLFAWYGDAARAIPVVRGHGIDQRGVDVAMNVLNTGGWIHIFSEGKVNQAPVMLSPFRWGVGKLIAECAFEPIVIPIYISGLERVFPEEQSRFPRFGHQFTFAVGDPIADIAALREQARAARNDTSPPARSLADVPQIEVDRTRWTSRPTSQDSRQVYSSITAKVEHGLLRLQKHVHASST